MLGCQNIYWQCSLGISDHSSLEKASSSVTSFFKSKPEIFYARCKSCLHSRHNIPGLHLQPGFDGFRVKLGVYRHSSLSSDGVMFSSRSSCWVLHDRSKVALSQHHASLQRESSSFFLFPIYCSYCKAIATLHWLIQIVHFYSVLFM